MLDGGDGINMKDLGFAKALLEILHLRSYDWTLWHHLGRWVSLLMLVKRLYINMSTNLAVLESSRLSNYRPRWLCSESCRTQQGSGTLFIFVSDEDASQILSLHIYTAPPRLKDMF